MLTAGLFDPERHPRGWRGRFASPSGQTSNAHAVRVKGRPSPPQIRRLHAITPIASARHFGGLSVKGAMAVGSGTSGD